MSSPLQIVFQIVANTPLWVWPLMALVVWLGLLGLRPRVLPLWRLAVLPAVGLVLSVAGIGQAVQPALALAAWLAALAVALPLGILLGRRRAVRHLDNGRLEVAGGWFMLVFGISIFAVRYALGVVFGMAPALKAEPSWIALSGGVGGFVAGIGLGWLGAVAASRSSPWIRRLSLAPAVVVLTIVAGFGGAIAFSAPGELPRLLAGDSLPGMASWNMAEIPAVQRVAARDGAPLTYRLYPARPDRAVVLVHGSSSASISMHKAAQALQAAGATVYSIDLRGHGGSGMTKGDTSYRSQLDDDLMDFLKAIRLDEHKIQKTSDRLLVRRRFRWCSRRVCANRAVFDAYLAISRYIAQDAPTTRPASGGWVSDGAAARRSRCRSSILRRTAVVSGAAQPCALPPHLVAAANGTPVYSFRLVAGLPLGRDWRGELARIDRPAIVAVGANDELFRAEQYGPLLAELNPRIAVAAGSMPWPSRDDRRGTGLHSRRRSVATAVRGERDLKVRLAGDGDIVQLAGDGLQGADLRGRADREIDCVERAAADQPGGVLALALVGRCPSPHRVRR